MTSLLTFPLSVSATKEFIYTHSLKFHQDQWSEHKERREQRNTDPILPGHESSLWAVCCVVDVLIADLERAHALLPRTLLQTSILRLFRSTPTCGSGAQEQRQHYVVTHDSKSLFYCQQRHVYFRAELCSGRSIHLIKEILVHSEFNGLWTNLLNSVCICKHPMYLHTAEGDASTKIYWTEGERKGDLNQHYWFQMLHSVSIF